MDSNL